MRLEDRLIVAVDRALSSKVGERYAPIRIGREVLKVLNDVAGQPICGEAEMERRRLRRADPLPPPPSIFRKKPGEGGAPRVE